MTDTKYHENPAISHVNAEPSHAIYDISGGKTLLSGSDWSFAFYPSLEDADEAFFAPGADLSALEQQIALLDSQIEAQEDEIAAQEELLAQLEQLIADKTIELKDSEEQQARQYDRMKDRVRYMAEHDNTSYLSILLASESFSDFLNRWEIIKQISVRDEELFEELKLIRDKVSAEKAELEAAQAEAQETKAQMEANMAELETQLAAQSTYVGGKFMWPLPAANNVVTCPYGMRKHPITGKYKLHTGVDLRCSTGTKVYAANAGTVTTSGYSSAWGNYIIINHGGGYTTLYAHLSRRNVAKGDKVKQGDVIGQSGNTGYSTAPHLHFEINKDGSSYDPLTEFKGFNYVMK